MGQNQSKVNYNTYQLNNKIISIILKNYSKVDLFDKISNNKIFNNTLCSILTPVSDLTELQSMKVNDVLKSDIPSNMYYYKRYSVLKSTYYLKSCNKERIKKCNRCNSSMYLYKEDGDEYSFPDYKYISEYFCSNSNCGLYVYYKYTPSCIII